MLPTAWWSGRERGWVRVRDRDIEPGGVVVSFLLVGGARKHYHAPQIMNFNFTY